MRLILRLVAVLAILVMVALPAAQVFNPAPVQAAWLTDYNYRKAISINGTADGDQTNYQMMLNVVADENGIPKSLVGTSTFANGWANNYWFQRKTLYMTGLTWAFYADGSNMVYKTSSDLGFSWNTTATIFATGARMGASTSLVFDGTHLHYAFNGAVDGEDLLYRMGTPDINGTITWATTEQTAVVIPAGWNSMYCNIIVQDDGYPQIGYCLKPADWPIHSVSAIVVRSSTDNGTWTTDAAFTKTLASGYVQMLNYPLGVALTGGKSYWAYAKDIIAAPYDYYYGDTWNGSAWVGEEPITDHVCAYGRYNLVSDGDNIHFASAGYDGATLKAYYYKRTYGIGWSSGVELIDSWSGGIGLTLTGSNSIIAAWTGAPTANHVYYRIMTNGVWASTVDWIDESVDTIPSTSSFQSMPSAIGTPYKLSVTYVTKAASPYSVIFKSLVQSDAGNVVNVSGTQADFDDIRFTKADGSTLLDYWLESKVNSQYANIWMKFDSIPNPGPTTFYVYYGYSAATASGNGTNTFPFFDDFGGTVLDPKWTLAGSGTATVASSKVTVLGPAPAGGWTTIRGNVSQSYGALRLKGSLNTTSFDKFGQSIDNAGTDATIFSVAPTPARNFSTWRAATATNTAITLTNDQLYTFDIIWKSGEIKAYQDGALVATHTTNLPTSAIPAEIGSYQNNAPAVVDWILLRNKTAIEPTFGTTGTKEGVPPTVTTQAVSSITSTTATSNGNITAIGSENATYQGIQWGLSSANYTTNVTTSGNFGIGAFTENLTGLPEGTTIHARAEAYNGFGWGYGDDVSFLTLPEVASFFSVAAGDGNITLSWTLGAGADNTTIIGNIGSYPATYADGVGVYTNTGTTYVHTPLLNGDHWYYRAWSSVTDNGTTQYSNTYTQGDATVTGFITDVFIAHALRR